MQDIAETILSLPCLAKLKIDDVAGSRKGSVRRSASYPHAKQPEGGSMGDIQAKSSSKAYRCLIAAFGEKGGDGFRGSPARVDQVGCSQIRRANWTGKKSGDIDLPNVIAQLRTERVVGRWVELRSTPSASVRTQGFAAWRGCRSTGERLRVSLSRRSLRRGWEVTVVEDWGRGRSDLVGGTEGRA